MVQMHQMHSNASLRSGIHRIMFKRSGLRWFASTRSANMVGTQCAPVSLFIILITTVINDNRTQMNLNNLGH